MNATDSRDFPLTSTDTLFSTHTDSKPSCYRIMTIKTTIEVQRIVDCKPFQLLFLATLFNASSTCKKIKTTDILYFSQAEPSSPFIMQACETT